MWEETHADPMERASEKETMIAKTKLSVPIFDSRNQSMQTEFGNSKNSGKNFQNLATPAKFHNQCTKTEGFSLQPQQSISRLGSCTVGARNFNQGNTSSTATRSAYLQQQPMSFRPNQPSPRKLSYGGNPDVTSPLPGGTAYGYAYIPGSNLAASKSILPEQTNHEQNQKLSSFNATSSSRQSQDDGICIYTVNIQGLKHWKNTNHLSLIFELYGVLDSAVVADNSGIGKEFVLRDETDTVKCIFYEIDRKIQRLTRGKWHRITGTLDRKSGRLKCFSVRPAEEEERKCAKSICSAVDNLLQTSIKRFQRH